MPQLLQVRQQYLFNQPARVDLNHDQSWIRGDMSGLKLSSLPRGLSPPKADIRSRPRVRDRVR